ncbi:MAG: hypothetical protein DSY76_04090 [Bacteroidetes bacterium]|nr:MAG: hypothetical protein DSY76_04090 [Bacteroidota bacterium]
MKKITLLFLISILSVGFNTLTAQSDVLSNSQEPTHTQTTSQQQQMAPKKSAPSLIEITPLVGYQFGGRVRFYEGDFKMDDNMNFGVDINFLVRQNHRIEIAYSLMKTQAHFRPYTTFIGDYDLWDGDVNINYILIGSHSELPVSEKVTLFGGVSLGASILTVSEPGISDVWRFGMGVTGGMKVAISDRIGIRLQGRLLMPMYFAGVGFYAGIGTGGASSGLSMNGGVLAFQGDFQGGLYFMLK